MKKVNVVSLFSGCGGLDFGFKEMGYNLIWANDILEDAVKTYKKNIGTDIICEDILKINPQIIPLADLVIGGPPCQGFSGIGKRNPKDDRSSLVWNYLDIINTVKPSVFLFENVTGIKSAKTEEGKKVIEELMKAFEGIGYSVELYTLNAADYGVPQKRKRVFIVGNNLNLKISPPQKTHSEDGISLKKWVSSFEALSDLGSPSEDGIVEYTKDPTNDFMKMMRKSSSKTDLHIIPYSSEKDKQIMRCITPGGNYMDVPNSIATTRILNFKKTGGRTTTYGRLHPDFPSYTLNTYFNRPNIGCNIHYQENRMITIREGMRLQSFPDDFSICSSNKRNIYVQVGNAVPPLLSLAWAKHLKKLLGYL